MGFQTGAISQPRTRPLIKRSPFNTDMTPPTPFNSTSFLIQQRRQQEEQVGPILDIDYGEFQISQFGSNRDNMLACCSFADNSHDEDCLHRYQANHPVIIGLLDHLHQCHSSNGAGATSGSRKRSRQVQASGSGHKEGRQRIKVPRRTKSVQDDNFAYENLISDFCGLRIGIEGR